MQGRNIPTIRQGQPGDEAALALVAGATFLETFAGIIPGPDIVAHCSANSSAAKFASWIADEESRCWLAEHEGTKAPVGYALLTAPDLPAIVTGEADSELKRIYLLARFRGGGVADMLMDRAVEAASSMGKTRLLLGVYGGNERAIAFYRKSGFEIIGERRFQVGAALFEDKIMGREI